MNTLVGRIVKASLLVVSAGLLMGNESCGKKPAPEPRALKKIIEVGKIVSPAIQLPDGNSFDFQFVVNQQIYSVLYDSKAFAFHYEGPVEGIGTFSDGSMLGRLKVSQASRDFYEKTMGISADQVPIPSKLAKCLLSKPQAKLMGSVNSFELLGGGGFSLGFNQLGSYSGAGIGANFKTDVYQLELQLAAISPYTKLYMSGVTQKSNKNDYAGGFTLQIGPFSAGPNYYYKTPLATVTRKALEGAVTALKNDMKKFDWFSRVLDYSEEDQDLVAIIGGANVDLKVGDQLMIYTETTYWQGEPCKSDLAYDGGVLGNPIAIVEINGVSPEISSGRMIEKYNDFNPEYIKGAKVMVHKLKDP